MPIVRRAVARMFGRFPNATVNPDEAVALGAAVQAGLKARDAALKEVVVTDVCPYSLGRRRQPRSCRAAAIEHRHLLADHRAQHGDPGEPRPQFPARSPTIRPGGIRHLSGRGAAGARQCRDRRDEGAGAARPGRAGQSKCASPMMSAGCSKSISSSSNRRAHQPGHQRRSCRRRAAIAERRAALAALKTPSARGGTQPGGAGARREML